MIRLKGLGHVALRVLDVERSKKFYADVLGFEVVEEEGSFSNRTPVEDVSVDHRCADVPTAD
jgi:catechol 2,3-dioxygenase-like lactoylglutathione lyase family enzyme